jgi:hypothetical protein
MDDGQVIPGLNEGYTLAGAKVMEWASGLVMAMISSELMQVNVATSGPMMIIVALGSVFSLAALRRGFPDEERGLRNSCMVALGFEPPGIPAPAQFRDYWSGAPMRAAPENSYFVQLNLEEVLALKSDEEHGSIFLQKSK